MIFLRESDLLGPMYNGVPMGPTPHINFCHSGEHLNKEQFEHPGYSLGICWIGDEPSHMGRFQTNCDPINFRSGGNGGLGQDEEEEMNVKRGTC